MNGLRRVNNAPCPTSQQLETTREVVKWYLEVYYGTDYDLGLIPMFCNSAIVGHFAVEKDQIASGEPTALFKLLTTVVMFQRLRDSHVLGILRKISLEDTLELTSMDKLIYQAKACVCARPKTNQGLIQLCDLSKDDVTKRGVCSVAPDYACYLKRHTELLRRYGHFGKVPTSAALVISEFGDLNQLREKVFAKSSDLHERAMLLEQALSKAWRISHKIAAMYLSILTVPNLGLDIAPWSHGIDWRHFVVIDGNVDAFLNNIKYSGSHTYAARRAFVQKLAKGVNLSTYNPALVDYNPRLVQQAMYIYMSKSNRMANPADPSI